MYSLKMAMTSARPTEASCKKLEIYWEELKNINFRDYASAGTSPFGELVMNLEEVREERRERARVGSWWKAEVEFGNRNLEEE